MAQPRPLSQASTEETANESASVNAPRVAARDPTIGDIYIVIKECDCRMSGKGASKDGKQAEKDG